jgi:hypothetical protein
MADLPTVGHAATDPSASSQDAADRFMGGQGVAGRSARRHGVAGLSSGGQDVAGLSAGGEVEADPSAAGQGVAGRSARRHGVAGRLMVGPDVAGQDVGDRVVGGADAEDFSGDDAVAEDVGGSERGGAALDEAAPVEDEPGRDGASPGEAPWSRGRRSRLGPRGGLGDSAETGLRVRPLGSAPLLDSEPLPATRPGMLRPRRAEPDDDETADSRTSEGFSLPVQRPVFDSGSGEPADIA